MKTLSFASDYQEGAHPLILERLCETNLEKSVGYGEDAFCASARNKIRAVCDCPKAAVHFLVGGTQTNATVIDALLKSYQGVLSAESGHISIHEAGAIEVGGHKVLTVPHEHGKISAQTVQTYCETFWHDENHAHMVMPGVVYISQPTEYGALYSLSELTSLHEVCKKYKMPLYVDGARMAYALASEKNDVTLRDMGRLCDVFYIGGTKCGALFGEAVVIPDPTLLPHFFTTIKQHGGLLAKGRLLGIQFDVLFTDGLYQKIGKQAIKAADRMRKAFKESGYPLAFETPTNQVFVILENSKMEQFAKRISFSFWEKFDASHTIVRLATSWATTEDDMELLQTTLRQMPMRLSIETE